MITWKPITTYTINPAACGATTVAWHTEPHLHRWAGASTHIRETRWVTCIHDAKAYLAASDPTPWIRSLVNDGTYRRARAQWAAAGDPAQDQLF